MFRHVTVRTGALASLHTNKKRDILLVNDLLKAEEKIYSSYVNTIRWWYKYICMYSQPFLWKNYVLMTRSKYEYEWVRT